MTYRLLPLLLCLTILPAFADDAVPTPAGTDAVPVPLRPADLEQLEKVLPASSRDASQLTRGATVVATVYTKNFDKDNPAWGPADSHWDGVYKQIYADTYRDAQTVASARGPAFNQQFATAVSQHLSERDLQTVLAYYRTDEGRRYRQFEDALDNIVANALIHAQRLVMLGTPPSADDLNKPVPEARLATRRQLIALSEGYRIVQQKLSANHSSPEDDTAAQKAVDMFVKLTNLAGADDLDKLGLQYQGDLGHFTSFSHSAPANTFYTALASATSEMMPALGDIQQTLNQAIQLHQSAWQTLYTQARAK